MPRPLDPRSLYESSAISPRFSFRLSLINLARALSLVAKVVAPIVTLCVAGLAVLHSLYLRNPARTDDMRNLTIDHFVVLEQMKRATALPAAMWDERLSTTAVNRFLIGEADLSRKRRAEAVDRMAAAWLLQGALDSLH